MLLFILCLKVDTNLECCCAPKMSEGALESLADLRMSSSRGYRHNSMTDWKLLECHLKSIREEN